MLAQKLSRKRYKSSIPHNHIQDNNKGRESVRK